MKLRDGKGPYTCLAANPKEKVSFRVCGDPNGWAWFQTVMSNTPYTGGPGVVWALAGAPAEKGKPVTPHLMVTVPLDPKQTLLPTGYTESDPYRPWIMFAGTDHAHLLMVHFGKQEVEKLMGRR